MLTSMVIMLSVLLSFLSANFAQDPVPTPVPTPNGGTCDGFGIEVFLPLKERDTSIHGGMGGLGLFPAWIYALECLSQDSDCRADHILGSAPSYPCGKVNTCFDIPLTRPLRSDEYIAVYAYPSSGYLCWWGVYRVAGALYLPLLFR